MSGRSVFTALLTIIVPVSAALADDEPEASPLTDVVISSGDQSVRIRFWVTVDAEPVSERFLNSQTAWVERLFERLDRDDDGRLSPDEASHAPSPQIELPESVLAGETENVNVAFNFRALDGNHDGEATADELLEFYRYFGDGSLRVRHPRALDVNDQQLHDALRTRLDEDGDGLMSREELSNATKLQAIDRDGNEVLDASELIGPVSDPVNVASTGAETREYRIRTAAPNGSVADLNVFINYPGGDSGALPKIAVQQANGQPNKFDADADRLSWRLNGVSVEFLLDCGPLRVLDRTRRVLALEFRGADADQDGIVRLTDRLPEYLEQVFPLLDADGDDAVSTMELDSFTQQLLPLESGTLGSQVSLNFIAPRDGVFAVLDSNHDGRLGARELHSAANRGEALDVNGNGSLEPAELHSPIRITMQRGSLTPPYATDRSPDSGPAWFTRMDRNRDGDLSPNEFLASSDLFSRIDADGDGLIGLSEALRVESIEGGL